MGALEVLAAASPGGAFEQPRPATDWPGAWKPPETSPVARRTVLAAVAEESSWRELMAIAAHWVIEGGASSGGDIASGGDCSGSSGCGGGGSGSSSVIPAAPTLTAAALFRPLSTAANFDLWEAQVRDCERAIDQSTLLLIVIFNAFR